MNEPPAFLFYPGDFIRDENVLLMDLDQVGSYIILLGHNWIEGSIPGRLEDCARLLGRECADPDVATRVLGPVLERFPVGDDGRRRNPRLEAERARIRARAIASRAGADARWGMRARSAHDARSMRAPCEHDARIKRADAFHFHLPEEARAREEQEPRHRTRRSPPVETPPDALPMDEGARRAAGLREAISRAVDATGAPRGEIQEGAIPVVDPIEKDPP